MRQITNKEYDAAADLIRGFLEEMEFVSYHQLPSVKNITKELKRLKYFENGITADQLGCSPEGERAVFICFDENKSLEDQFKPMTGEPLEAGDPVVCYIVILVKTMDAKQKVDAREKDIRALAKRWLINRTVERQRSRIRFCTLHAPTGEEKCFPIAIKSRIRALHYVPEMDEDVKIASDVYTAKLFDIVSLYNHVGTALFERNVRYHIRDVLNVESEIQKTLADQPSAFFNSNNGIAIQIRKCGDLDRRNENDIRLTHEKKGDLSVINGAQTISAAADFFFQQTESGAEGKDQREKIERAKKNAWVLLRVFYPVDGQQKNCGEAFDQISISLNRQKPMSPMDVEYACPGVRLINALYEKNRDNPYYFKILKRGQEEPGRFQYQLSDFGRMVTAYYHNIPATARSGVTQNIVRYHAPSEDLAEPENAEIKSIYAPFGNDAEDSACFLSWYKPMNFAGEIARVYSQAEKEYRTEADSDVNTLVVLGNGRYFFIAYVINMLNNTDRTAPGNPSFAGFDYDADSVKASEEELIELAIKYAGLAARFALEYLKENDPERNTLNSNDFKTKVFYEKWCEHAGTDQAVLNWNKEIRAVLDVYGGGERTAAQS